MEQLLAPHYRTTTTRISHEKVVLVAQDTTTLNYDAHPMTEGLGHIGYSTEHGIGLMELGSPIFMSCLIMRAAKSPAPSF